MTKEEAVKAVDNTLGDYRNKQLVLKVKDQGADVSIEEMGAEVENIDKLAEKDTEKMEASGAAIRRYII